MELLSRLRDSGSIVPVVILTAHGSIPEAVAAMKLGAIDFLTKPITPEALRRAVAEVIERHSPIAPAIRPAETIPIPPDQSKQLAFDLARAKRALNRGQFSEAETLLREFRAGDPGSAEVPVLLDRLEKLKEQESQGPYRILRDWFPSGNDPEEVMMALATLALGLAIFGLFFAMVTAASTSNRKDLPMLYLTGVLTVAALFYLAYVMILPEKF